MIPLGVLASSRVASASGAIVREYTADITTNGPTAGVGKCNFRPAGGFLLSGTDRFGNSAQDMRAALHGGGGFVVENLTRGTSRYIIGPFAVYQTYDSEASTWWNITVRPAPPASGDVIRVTHWASPDYAWDRAAQHEPHLRTYSATESTTAPPGKICPWAGRPMISVYAPDSLTSAAQISSTTSTGNRTLEVIGSGYTYTGTFPSSTVGVSLYPSLTPAFPFSNFVDGEQVEVRII